MARAPTLCVLLLSALSPVLPAPVDVDVLVFVPRNDSFLFSRARVAPALRYAQERLRADGSPFSALRFNLHFGDSDCANAALFSLVERSCTRRPDLILGPVCEYEAAAVVRLASHWGVPVISAGALATAFGTKDGEYAQLTRIAPSYVKMAQTFTAMFAHFSWRSALLVLEDDKHERNCYFTLEGVYHLMGEHSIRSVSVSEDEPLHVDELLQNIHDTEVVIMCMAADKIRELMLAAHRHHLTSGACMFFNVELFNASSYGDGSWRRGDGQDDEARQAFAALNTVTLLRTVKPEFQSFSIEMTNSVQRGAPYGCRDCGNVNVFVEGFHDAMLLYALALHDAMTSGYTKDNGSEVTARMWNRTFEGIAGQVSVDVNGDRDGDFSLMSMTDREKGTYEVVANYFGVNGTLQLLPTFDPGHFTLRGSHSVRTDTPDKSCGLGVSAMTAVTVGAVVGVAMLVAFYFFRKNYRVIIERRTLSEDSGKHRQLREDSIRSNFSAA